ncbi:hypothetical protein E3I18_00635 [Candidatus Woesebacteria bacterium]|nr:MAG: hypothetical protein E3I18_00635 [Candidatus Woesebacteria bacterium]
MPKKLLLFIVITLLIISSLFLASYLFVKMTRSSKTNMEKQIVGYDLRLKKAYLSSDKKDYYTVGRLAMNDCEETQEVKPGPALPSSYIKQLKADILAKMNISNDLGLLFINEPISNTETCWLVWLVDGNGVGVAGYRNNQGELIIFETTYPREKLTKIFESPNENFDEVNYIEWE